MERYICIHGHFYQPPRENPWLDAIELQDSAYPYHDWNERITAECYGPNATSRILDGKDRILRIVNNYARISFNFGPTLLAWMEEKAPDTYRAILEADAESQHLNEGHGSALAQAYNHMILPLASMRDKNTQVVWGIRDFEHRFGRKPEGMWLPETAVDVETLEILAENGIRFTILAPNQARRVRPRGGRRWRDVSNSRIDPTMAYEMRLPSGGKIALFFYDGPVSRAVAFEDLLRRGEVYTGRLLGAFSEDRAWPQLVHIATDGETYGHHHRYGDMALAYALHHIESSSLATLTNYGRYLERVPPTHQVEIFEDSSWSCIHGVERWRSDCGCSSGGFPGWSHAWRAPLREALDRLRDRITSAYEETAGRLFMDPWEARNDYIEVVLDRSAEARDRFLDRHKTKDLSGEDRITAWKLLELQRNAMLMYTSCGWFFDEISGIETVQVLQYAGRCIQLGQDLFGEDLEGDFLEHLEKAPSNVEAFKDGGDVYRKLVNTAMVDLHKVAAHYAVSLLFQSFDPEAHIHGYRVERRDHAIRQAGKARMATGRLTVTSEVTEEHTEVVFGVLHFGDHNLTGGVQEYRGEEGYRTMVEEVSEAFSRADLPEVVRQLDRHFDGLSYSLKALFRDEQRKILNHILESTLDSAEAVYRQLYENNASLMRFLTELGFPLPGALRAAGEYVLNRTLRDAVTDEEPDIKQIRKFFKKAVRENLTLDTVALGYSFKKAAEKAMNRFTEKPADLDRLLNLEALVRLVRSAPFDVDLGAVQNVFYDLLTTAYPGFARRAEEGKEQDRTWVLRFRALGKSLRILVK